MWLAGLVRPGLRKLTFPAWVVLISILIYWYYNSLETLVKALVRSLVRRDVELGESLVIISVVLISLWAVSVVASINLSAERRAHTSVQVQKRDHDRDEDQPIKGAPKDPLRSALATELIAALRMRFHEPKLDEANLLAAHRAASELIREWRRPKGRWERLRLTHAQTHIEFAVAQLFVPTDSAIAAASMRRSNYAGMRRRELSDQSPDFHDVLAYMWLLIVSPVLNWYKRCKNTTPSVPRTEHTDSASGQSMPGTGDDPNAPLLGSSGGSTDAVTASTETPYQPLLEA